MQNFKLLTAVLALATMTGPVVSRSFTTYDENENGNISRGEFYG